MQGRFLECDETLIRYKIYMYCMMLGSANCDSHSFLLVSGKGGRQNPSDLTLAGNPMGIKCVCYGAYVGWGGSTVRFFCGLRCICVVVREAP